MAISIQFYGIDDVLNAVEKSKCSYWAIFQGRQFMFKSELHSLEESIALLKEILESLAENSVIYTIKLYESNGNEDRKIDEKTKCDAGSFNFKLTELEDLTQRRERYIMGRVEKKSNVEQRLLDMEAKQNEILLLLNKEAGIEDDDEETLEEAIIGVIQDPPKLLEIISMIKRGQDMLMGRQVSPSSIGNILAKKPGQIEPGPTPAPDPGQPNLSQPSEDDIRRLSCAIDVLSRNDPNIIDNLERLAILSQEKPGTYQMAVKMLNGM